MSQLGALRTVTNVIQSLPPKELPQRAQFFATAIENSAAVLSGSESHATGKDISEAAVLVHKYKTQVSTLLNGKSPEGRWIAVVLIKTTVQAGGWEILRGCESWVRGLLGLFNKPSSTSSRILQILTLSRIYELVKNYPTLVREIATPTLPAFISGCIKFTSKRTDNSPHALEPDGSSPLLQAVLEMFNRLLTIYPTVFRPFLGQLHSVVTPLIAPAPSTLLRDSSLVDDENISELARQLFAVLHFCAPKNTSGEYWKKTFDSVMEETHLTTDQVFRGILEDWESSSGIPRPTQSQASYTEQISIRDGPLSLPKAQGIFNGMQRLAGLLRTLRVILATESATPVQIRLGFTLDLISRLTSVTTPGSSRDGNSEFRINPDIDRLERDAMFCELPKIHVAAMSVVLTMGQRFEKGFVPLATNSLDQVLWVFDAEKDIQKVRGATYETLTKLLKLGGLSLSSASMPIMSKLVQKCCDDLLPTQSQSSPNPVLQNGGPKTLNNVANADSFLPQSSSSEYNTPHLIPDLQYAASTLLPILLAYLPTSILSPSIRALIDSTAIMTKNKEAMIASVLRPQTARRGAKVVSSIIPHLARTFGGDPDVEGLLRPRMPVVMTGTKLEDLNRDFEEAQIPHGQDHMTSYSGSKDPRNNGEDILVSESYQPMEITYHNSQPSPADLIGPDESTESIKHHSNNLGRESPNSVAETAREKGQPGIISPKRYRSTEPNGALYPVEHTNKRSKIAQESEADTTTQSPQGKVIVTISPSLIKSDVLSDNNQTKSLKTESFKNVKADDDQERNLLVEDDDDDDFEVPTLVLDADTSDDEADEADEDQESDEHRG